MHPASAKALVKDLARPTAGAAVAAVVVLVAVFSGTVQSTDATLVLMGFDPDRAQLITGLIVGAVAAVAATLLLNRIRFGTAFGAVAVAALYVQTFTTETQNALASSGATGQFNPRGWVLTIVTVVVIGILVGWAGATLAAGVRPALIAAGHSARDLARPGRPDLRLALKPIAVVLVVILLGVTVPAFGDMVNLSPDVLMLDGGPQAGLVPGNSFPDPGTRGTATPTATPTAPPTALQSATASPYQTADPTSSPSATARRTYPAGSKPWLAWKPSGAGKVTVVQMPAPWSTASQSTEDIVIYTPPGYDPAGSTLYPVMYEAPTGYGLWNHGTDVYGALNDLIDTGRMPAAIAVFIDSSGAPKPDTECADTPDNQQWFETYISQTVVQYVDANYRTIKEPGARGIMGMSAGGFCAPMLALRHPDVFGVSISFSGYFWVGAAGVDSAAPFSPSGVNSHSPAWLASGFTGADRPYFIVIANPAQRFYGPAADQFNAILARARFDYLSVKSLYVHSWPQVRYETPGALEAWGARLAVNGVW
jgi:enterochelin esterase-like enzyme